MSKLTTALLHRQSGMDYRLWCEVLTGHGESYVACILPAFIDADRLEMMLDPEEGGFANYFESEWFPLVRASSAEEAEVALEAKVNSIDASRLLDYVALITRQWQFIEDNFAARMPVDFEEAVQEDIELQNTIAKTFVSPTA